MHWVISLICELYNSELEINKFVLTDAFVGGKTNGEAVISLILKEMWPPGLHEAISSFINCGVKFFLQSEVFWRTFNSYKALNFASLYLKQ
jgi:hypothetical protein